MNRILFTALVIVAFVYFWMKRAPDAPHVTPTPSPAPIVANPPPSAPSEPVAQEHIQVEEAPREKAEPMSEPPPPEKKKMVLPYVMEEGLIVVQGDVVLGKPTNENAPDSGWVKLTPMKTWPGATIAYHIQPDLPNPDRVNQAIALFEGTAVHFVPYTNQEDALVFGIGNEHCKSYVGMIGGKQPIWLSAECGPTEIAHEIMHALGFVHEQNRSDRDDFIQVNFDNIDDKYRDNFEKLPPEFMKLSGLSSFDFESIMIYPVWMFVKNGQATMESKIHDQQIQPSKSLSKLDVDRINRAYAR